MTMSDQKGRLRGLFTDQHVTHAVQPYRLQAAKLSFNMRKLGWNCV